MYFKDLIASESEWLRYEQLLRSLSKYIADCISRLLSVYHIVEQHAAKDRSFHHATVGVLVRHVCEFTDGVSVLVVKGCSEPCKPLLRSAFEAVIGVCYILEKDSERRGLAYQVAHAHKKIKLYRRMKPNEQSGKELCQLMQSDPVGATIHLPTLDYQRMIDDLDGMLKRPEYATIEQAWNTAKKKRRADPYWYSLFGGPSNIRSLAIYVKHALWYEFLYRNWSDTVHAGGCLENRAKSEDGTHVMRPIRHPDGLQAWVSLAGTMCLELCRRLIDHYAPDQRERFRIDYVNNLQARLKAICDHSNLINAPWK